MERAVNGDNITLSQHLLQIGNTSATNLLLNLWLKRLVIEVQQFLAVEWLETAENSLTNTTDGDSSDDFAFEIVFVLSHLGDVPISILNLLVGGGIVADEDEDAEAEEADE